MIVALHLIFLPWALGGMRLWGQLISLGLAVTGFYLACQSRVYSGDFAVGAPFLLNPRRKLWRFPVFWLGLGLLAYVAIQGLNPAWVYQSDGQTWWMRQVDFIHWLPAGVTADFDRGGGPWRSLLVYASAWLTMCTLWVGCTRRRSVRIIFMVIAGNGFALACFGLIQRLLSNRQMFWLWYPPNDSFFASFIYKNHAGTYLNLALAVAAGLAAWRYLRGVRRMEKSNSASMWLFFGTVIALSIFVSYARGAATMMIVFLVVVGVGFALHQWLSPQTTRRPLIIAGLLVMLGGFLLVGLQALQGQLAWDRLNQGFSGGDASLAARHLATRATLDMAPEYGLRGAGAGSFRYLFPQYQKKYPALWSYQGQLMHWEHAHNDLLEFPLELGLGGSLFLLAGAGWWLRHQYRHRCWRNPLGAIVGLGLLLTLLHAWWDFLFQCPAILILWCTLLVATALWSRFESHRLTA